MPKKDDDFDFDKILNTLITLGGKLVQNDRGVSLLAVIAGITLKQIPRSKSIRPEYVSEPWFASAKQESSFCSMSVSEQADFIARHGGGNFDVGRGACQEAPEIAVDLFPINNLFGLPIDPNLGKVPISDLLIAMGAFGVAGGVDAIAKLIEIIKPKLLT